MLIAILIVFALLWGPNLIFTVLKERFVQISASYELDRKLNYIFQAVTFLSSSVNPIVLPLTSK